MIGWYLNASTPALNRSPGGVSVAQWLLGTTGCGGLVWPDETGLTAGATVSSSAKWVGSPGSPSLAEVEASGGNGVTLALPYVGGVGGSTYGDSWILSFWFTPLSFGSGTYNNVIDEANRWLSSFYNSSGTNTFASTFGTLTAGVRYRLSLAYCSTGTTATVPGVRTYTNAVGFGTTGYAAGTDPFITMGTTMSVSLGGNPSGGASGFMTARYGGIRFVRYQAGSATTVADQLVALDYREASLGYPTFLNRWSRRNWIFGQSGSSPVTVALTGQSTTSALGTLTPSAAVTLTGLAGTGGTGTLSPTLSPTLTGQYVTAYGPTSIPCPDGQARQYDVGPFTGGTGDYATLTGTVRVSRDTAYDEDGADTGFWRVGYSGTVGPWTVVLQYATPVDGSTRFLAVFCSSAAPADMSYGQDTGVTSCCGTYTTFSEGGSGTGTQPDPPDVAPVGLCDGCGDLFPTAAVAQTGQAVTSAAGTVTYSASTALTGLSSTTDTGTLTPETGYVLSLTGQEITASTGSPTPAVATSLTGDNATGAAGTMVVGVAYTLVGNGVTTAAGAVTVTIAATLTGDAATTAAGTLTADLSAALTGNSTTTTTGTLTPELAAAIVGLSTTPAQGTIDPQTGWLIPLTGQSVTISQGTLGVSITVGITGQSAAVSQGSLTASVYVPFGELYGKWAYPQPKTGRWQYTSPKAGKWTYPDELAGRWTPSV